MLESSFQQDLLAVLSITEAVQSPFLKQCLSSATDISGEEAWKPFPPAESQCDPHYCPNNTRPTHRAGDVYQQQCHQKNIITKHQCFKKSIILQSRSASPPQHHIATDNNHLLITTAISTDTIDNHHHNHKSSSLL